MSDELIGIEVPWLFTKVNGAIHLADKPGFDAYLNAELADGEMGMAILVPLAQDRYHAGSFRYYRNTVLPLIAEYVGEPNPERTHADMTGQLLPLVPARSRRRSQRSVIQFTRRSTSMLRMPAVQFLDYLDRLIAFATVDLGLLIPLADRCWRFNLARMDRALTGGQMQDQDNDTTTGTGDTKPVDPPTPQTDAPDAPTGDSNDAGDSTGSGADDSGSKPASGAVGEKRA